MAKTNLQSRDLNLEEKQSCQQPQRTPGISVKWRREGRSVRVTEKGRTMPGAGSEGEQVDREARAKPFALSWKVKDTGLPCSQPLLLQRWQ